MGDHPLNNLPDISDLAEGLRFAPDQGRIWLQGRRSALLSAEAIGEMRREAIDALGHSAARDMFSRIGYAEGSRSAAFARKLRPGMSYFEAFAVGPQANALSGFSWTEVVSLEADADSGQFDGLFRLHDSLEGNMHLEAFGPGTEPVCWLQSGFASGFASAFAGRAILMREIQCRGMGHSECVIHGQPLEKWGKVEPEATFFHPAPDLSGIDTNSPEGEEGLIGISAGFATVLHRVRKTAPSDATLMFTGETGVGKEVLARLAHRLSRRHDKPFVAVNCAAIPEELVEAELFGVERGAFTGASRSRPGRFERADGGTLFLDEVTSLSLQAQGKMLRAIQELEIERVGDIRTRKVDVRILAASNIDLRKAVSDGQFREDLYFRLSTIPLRVPPLRERPDDIPLFMEHFRKLYCQRYDREILGFTRRAVELLLTWRFPGNVRELQHRIERAVLLAEEGEAIDIVHLFSEGEEVEDKTLRISRDGQLRASPPDNVQAQALDFIEAVGQSGDGSAFEVIEHALLEAALSEADGNVAAAARRLGLTRRQFDLRLKKRRASDF